MIWFTADWHLNEDFTIGVWENRPGDYNRRIAHSIASLELTEDDEVYVLGDIGDPVQAARIIQACPAHFYLVKGNHDKKDDTYYKLNGFEKVYDHPIIIEDFWILSHEPMYMNEYMPYVNIFGHVHGNPMYKTYSRCGACVCVERNNYGLTPFTLIKTCVKEAYDNDY